MDEPRTKPNIWQASSLVGKPNVKPNTGPSSSVVASDGSITIQGVVCKPYEEDGMTVVDLRPAGVLKEAFPIERLKNPEKSKILLCHENVLRFLESTIDSLPPNITIEIFDYCDFNHPYAEEVDDKYLWKTCYIAVDQHGLIFLDLGCKALKGQPLKFSTKKKLHQVILRNYEEGVLVRNSSGTFESLEELIIADGEPGERTLTIQIPFSFGKFPQISLSGVNVIHVTSPERTTYVQLCGQCKEPFLGEMVNLKKLFLSAARSRMSLTGMDKLPNLVEVTVIDNRFDCIADFFQNMTKVKKLTLVNCGLRGLPAELEDCSELQELNLYNNSSLGYNPIVFPKLPHLKKLDLSGCGLKQLPDGLEECSELQELDLKQNGGVHDNLTVFPKLPHLKKLDLSECDLKQLPVGLEECSELQDLNLYNNSSLGYNPIVFPKLPHLKKLDLSECDLQQLPGLEECSELQELDLKYNLRLCDNLAVFPKLPHLKKLDLSNCHLKQLPDGLEGCSELQELALKNTWGSLANLTIPKLPHLKKLDLSQSGGLQQLPDGLEECSELQELDLSKNWSLCDKLTVFPKLPHLKKLDLSLCGLKQLPAGLSECCELKGLVVSGGLVDGQLLSAFKLQKVVGPLFDCFIYTRRSKEEIVWSHLKSVPGLIAVWTSAAQATHRVWSWQFVAILGTSLLGRCYRNDRV